MTTALGRHTNTATPTKSKFRRMGDHESVRCVTDACDKVALQRRGALAMQTLKAAVLYFAIVFGAGFVLGPLRILWVAPGLGTRTAELIEAPIMLATSSVAAQWIVRRLAVPARASSRLGMGIVALALMLMAE